MVELSSIFSLTSHRFEKVVFKRLLVKSKVLKNGRFFKVRQKEREKKNGEPQKGTKKFFSQQEWRSVLLKKSLHPNIHEITVFLRGTYF